MDLGVGLLNPEPLTLFWGLVCRAGHNRTVEDFVHKV